jgi:hypothetical protein
VIKDTSIFCSSDTTKFNLQPGIKVFPMHTGEACLFTCNGNASVNIPNVTPSSIIWYAEDTVFTNVSSINYICPGQDTVIVSVAGCGSDTCIFTMPQTPFITINVNAINQTPYNACPPICTGSVFLTVNGGGETQIAIGVMAM